MKDRSIYARKGYLILTEDLTLYSLFEYCRLHEVQYRVAVRYAIRGLIPKALQYHKIILIQFNTGESLKDIISLIKPLNVNENENT